MSLRRMLQQPRAGPVVYSDTTAATRSLIWASYEPGSGARDVGKLTLGYYYRVFRPSSTSTH